MAKEKSKKIPAMARIREMEVGETVQFPAESVTSVRANLSTYAFMLDRKYKTHMNREEHCFDVTRIS